MKQTQRILIVDDELPNRELLEALVTQFGHETELAKDGFEAMAMLKLGFDLVLLDLMMPGMDGFEVIRRIRGESESNDVPIILVTSLSSKEDRLRGVEAGANDFVAKPIDRTELQLRMNSLLKMKEAQDALKRHRMELEALVAQQTTDLRKTLREMSEANRNAYQAHLDTIERLAIAAEYKDKDTAIHIRRMSRYCYFLARKLNLTPKESEIILHASPMHDVGKMGIPDAILLKPGKLDEQEWEIMKQHTDISARILGGSSSELLQAGEIIAMTHHEKWDGSGYPKGLKGAEIPIMGRICAIADVFDALTSKRPYKEAFSNEKALEIMKEGKGKAFEPELLDLFFANFDEVKAIQQEIKDS